MPRIGQKKFNLEQTLKRHLVRTGEHGLTGKSQTVEENSVPVEGELRGRERTLTEKSGSSGPIVVPVQEVENVAPEKIHLRWSRSLTALERRIRRTITFWRPELSAAEKDLEEIKQRNRRIAHAMEVQCKIANQRLPTALAKLGIIYERKSNSKHERWKDERVHFDCWRWSVDGATVFGHVDKIPFGHSPSELTSEGALMVCSQAVGRPVSVRVDDKGGGTILSISLMGTNDLPEFVDFGSVFSLVSESAAPLTVCLGVTQNGAKKFQNLEIVPHLLVAGATGSGKSCGMMNLVAQLVGRNDPATLRILLCDLKRMDLNAFITEPPIPHLITEIPGIPLGYIDRDNQVLPMLEWLSQENNRRGDLLAKHKIRNITAWNLKHRRQALPRICVFIDEFSRLFRFESVEKRFIPLTYDLAATGRSCGIHLIISTQYPTSKYISTDIKQNFPGRLCYSMTSLTGSLVMLETGEGLNLYPPAGRCVWGFGVDHLRLQSPFVSQSQINTILKNARSGKTLKAVQLSAGLSEEQILRWCRDENNSSLSEAAAFYKFSSLISHRDLQDLLRSMDGKTFTLDGESYIVRPSLGGPRGRLLVKLAIDGGMEKGV